MAEKKSSKAERLARLRKATSSLDLGGQSGFFSPQEGKNQIRILPEAGEMEIFYQPVGIHYLGGNQRVYCPSFTSEKSLKCPICEVVRTLYKSNNPADKALAGKIRVRKKYWMNVIDRKNSSQGPLVFTPGQVIMSHIVALINDPDYGDVSDPDAGFDIVITRKGTGIDTEYNVVPRRDETPLHKDAETVKDWIEKARDLSFVEVSNDPEEDGELSAGHMVYVLPYDRIAKEFDMESLIDDADEDDEDYEEEEFFDDEESFDDDDTDDEELEDEDLEESEEEEEPAKDEVAEEIQSRKQGRTRRRTPRRRRTK